MSKRAGTFVTLRDLYEETGPDVARYFFLMRRAEVPMTFDLDLALDTSEKNPVYKVQYAHARMCSIFERAGVEPGSHSVTAEGYEALLLPSEREVAKHVLRFPEIVASAAASRAPYQVCNFLEELASVVNGWYHEGNVDSDRRVLAEGPARECAARSGERRADHPAAGSDAVGTDGSGAHDPRGGSNVNGSRKQGSDGGAITYRDAGVDLRAAEGLTRRLADLVEQYEDRLVGRGYSARSEGGSGSPNSPNSSRARTAWERRSSWPRRRGCMARSGKTS